MKFIKTLIPFFATIICMGVQPALSSAGSLSSFGLVGGGIKSLVMQLVILAIAAGVIRFFAAGTIVARIALPALGIIAVLIVLQFLLTMM